MTEREMKNIIGDFIGSSLKNVVIPAAVGVGLAFTAVACGEMDEADQQAGELTSIKDPGGFYKPMYAVPFPTPQKCVGTCECADGSDGTLMPIIHSPLPVAMYSAIMYIGKDAQVSSSVGNIVALYSAQVPIKHDAGVTAKYMGPFPGKDGGVVAKYMAPTPTVPNGCYCNCDGNDDNNNDNNGGDITVKYSTSFPQIR